MPKASETYNLLTLRPDLAREWHPTKNGTLGPKDVTPGSAFGNGGEGAIRICCAADESVLEPAMARLRRFLEKR